MLRLIFHRLLQGVFVLMIVSALTFALLAAAGGDALTTLGDDPRLSEEMINVLRGMFGLDQPLHVRFLRWLSEILRGRMGYSFFYQAPVGSIIWPRLLNTLALAAAALFIAWPFALLMGALAARREGALTDQLCGVVILVAASTPRIVLALVALAVTARLSLFTPGAVAAFQRATGIILPALVLSVPLVALFLAQTRDALKSALREEFVRAARAKGLSESVVVRRHALRAALNPLITVFGLSLGGVMSGSVVVETVLGWPGLGQLSVVAVRARDVPLLMAVVLVTATAVLAGNLVADILLRLNDPRLRLDEANQRGR
ncbi:MAG: ABC transporter permease [Acidobacteriota bacterium]|nr:ABC transporter permease [Acidobacteriota bacterium]